MMNAAGFRVNRITNFAFGAVQLYEGRKGYGNKIANDLFTNPDMVNTTVYEEQWEVPSGGDWALHRSGAVFLQGTKDARISGGVFKRLDGNAIML